MAHFRKHQYYRIYLLAVWAERGRNKEAQAQWRYSLEDPHTGQRRGFASLEALTVALGQVVTDAGVDGESKGGDADSAPK